MKRKGLKNRWIFQWGVFITGIRLESGLSYFFSLTESPYLNTIVNYCLQKKFKLNLLFHYTKNYFIEEIVGKKYSHLPFILGLYFILKHNFIFVDTKYTQTNIMIFSQLPVSNLKSFPQNIYNLSSLQVKSVGCVCTCSITTQCL